MMVEQGLDKKLAVLIRLDIDAIFCYDKAFQKIDEAEIKEEFLSFRADHERHISLLRAELRKLGQEASFEQKTDIKGMFLAGAATKQSIAGTLGTLKAMQLNEKLTNRTYSKAAKWKVSESLHSAIVKNFEDERKHLQYLTIKIDGMTWNKEPGAGKNFASMEER